jgi:hypothetical protein
MDCSSYVAKRLPMLRPGAKAGAFCGSIFVRDVVSARAPAERVFATSSVVKQPSRQR